MDYLDFELELGVGSGREYPVAVVHSAAGEAHETMHFPCTRSSEQEWSV